MVHTKAKNGPTKAIMSNSWVLDRLPTSLAIRNRWHPGMFSTMDCDWLHNIHTPKAIVYFKPCDYVDLQSITRDLKNMLRAPWNVYNFYLQDENKQLVKDSNGDVVTSQTCREWLAINDTDHTRLNFAWGNDPTTFLGSYPTWGTGTAYSFNFWEALHNTTEYNDINPSKSIQFEMEFHALAFKNAANDDIELESSETPDVYPMGREFFSTNSDWSTYGLTCTSGSSSLNGPTYSGQYRYTVSADNTTNFDTKVSNMAQLLHIAFSKGIQVPFNFSHLPHIKGYRRIELSIQLYLRFGDVYISFYDPTLVLKVTSEQYLDHLNVSNIDWTPLSATHAGRLNATNCLKTQSITPNTTMPSEIMTKMEELHQLVRQMDLDFHESENWSDKLNQDIRLALVGAIEDSNEMIRIATYPNNMYRHQSEAILLALDVYEEAYATAKQMENRGLLPVTQIEVLIKHFNSLSFDDVLGDYPNLYQHEFTREKRPLYVRAVNDRIALNEKLEQRLDDARKSRMSQTGVIILSVILGIMCFALLYFFVFIKK